jgi:putative methionine-R-sulfoxide reductase with GAF domain
MEESKYTKIIFEMAEWGNTISALLYFQKEICLLNSWSYSEIWQLDQSEKFMVWAGYWSNKNSHFEKFAKYSSYFKFANGIGLIGKSWEQKHPVICDNLAAEQAFLRSDIAVKSKLNSMVAIPILKEDQVTNIISVYFDQITEFDKKECAEVFNSLNQYSLNKIP